ncbi:chitobiase/beta-hexosaminidase C-terminal domain-containing protein [Paenibacillus sp. GCM10012307]|uniref:Chitobiase/beta-hexosaminidase C-terminal domain-containing protein n=1 Tax=Paenibacillus roseus TaxID=2798579 RepID=A0A934J6H3_9BACL|nr:chitobiase/beta-hexosaminidase C-terminal domain-containing protein [Paenibacillus roseus]MBJ6362629.1 chitobiase/beta-hexosaminidase C-terminal domain-containing protein [Paenibacillus roseus]
MRKKFVGLLMAVLLCFHFSVSFAVGATKTSADFTDLKDLDAKTKAKFDAMISAGVFDGVGDDKFGLKDEMNRAQFAKVAALIFDLKVDTSVTTSSFKDVKADDPANGYALPFIEAVKAAGITDGYGAGVYNPAGKVTKEQLATFLIRGLDMKENAMATPGVNDSTVSDWAKGYVALALELKLLDNGADLKFGGQTNATRDLLLTGAYEAKGHYVAQVEQVEQKTKEEEEKKEKEKKKQEEQSWYPTSPPVQVILETPTALPAGGAVVSNTQVSLSATGGATIYYTTDGSTPTRTNGLVYSVPIVVDRAMTVKAIAVQNGKRDSSIMSASYTINVPKSALDLINEASESGNWTDVNVTTFGDAGVTDVIPEHLDAIKIALEIDSTPYPRTLSQIQAIVSQTIETLMVTAIYDYLNPFGGESPPTLQVFALAGITGVTASNLAEILDELSWAYQDSRSGQYGTTPMSTKQDIQNVVDRLLIQP